MGKIGQLKLLHYEKMYYIYTKLYKQTSKSRLNNRLRRLKICNPGQNMCVYVSNPQCGLFYIFFIFKQQKQNKKTIYLSITQMTQLKIASNSNNSRNIKKRNVILRYIYSH